MPVRESLRRAGQVDFMDTPEPDIFARNGWLRSELLNPAALKAVERSVCWAADTRWESLRTPHLFMGVLSVGDRHVREWCRMIGSDVDSLLLQFAKLFTHNRAGKPPVVRLNREFLSENALRVLRHAHKRAQRSERSLQIIDLMVALFSPAGGIVAGCFADVGYPPERLAAMAVAAEERNPETETR
jgi:ATP-dependent Clp protease ATP-binding subunit ClpA